jgi:iron complex outermembrane receptor protein
VRGHVGLDWRYKNFSVQPEVVIANRQDRIFTTETETAGYAVFNLRGSYTVTKQHALQMFSVNLYNAGDRLYRNHLSFIKEFAPEIGRGVQFSYTIRFF